MQKNKGDDQEQHFGREMPRVWLLYDEVSYAWHAVNLRKKNRISRIMHEIKKGVFLH